MNQRERRKVQSQRLAAACDPSQPAQPSLQQPSRRCLAGAAALRLPEQRQSVLKQTQMQKQTTNSAGVQRVAAAVVVQASTPSRDWAGRLGE